MDEKMRAEFEAWANSFFSNAPTKYKRDALPKDDPNYGDYVSKSLQVAWLAWQASRAALVVELPEKISQYNTDDVGFVNPAAAEHDEAIDDCRAAIESAGVRVKP